MLLHQSSTINVNDWNEEELLVSQHLLIFFFILKNTLMDKLQALEHRHLHRKQLTGMSGSSHKNSISISIINGNFRSLRRLSRFLDILWLFIFLIFAFSFVSSIYSGHQLIFSCLIVIVLFDRSNLSQSVVNLGSQIIFIIF